MKKLLLTLLPSLLFLLLSATQASAQISSGTAYRIVSGESLPLTCEPGPGITDVYIITAGGSPAAGVYYCSATDTWTALAGGGGGSGTVTNTGTLTSSKAIIGNGGVDVKASKITLTDPATTATITIANNKTFTVSNTLTFTGTDSSSVAFGAGGTVLYNGGALGTPSSGTLTNATGLPISTGVSGLGTGIATFLATPSSANLATAVTDETGSGVLVFGTAPTFTTSITDPLVIGGTGVGSTLTLKSTSGVGATDAIIFQVGNNGAVEGGRFYTTGAFGMGTGSTAPLTAFQIAETVTTTPRGIMNSQHSDSTNSAQFNLYKSRGTYASPITVVTGDVIGNILFAGYDGANYLNTAAIRVTSTGTIGSTRVPTTMEFRTGTDAAPSVLTTAVTINANQTVTFAGAITVPSCTGCGGATFANPTATIGLSAVNGVATDAMRADAAPALSQAIVPTWTGIHTFNNGVTTGTGATAGTVFTPNSLTTGQGISVSSTSVTSGTLLNLASTSTAALTGFEALNIAVSGANGSTAQTITGGRISVTNTNGTSGTNVALELTASGATTANTALNVTAGQILTPNGTVSLPAIGLGGTSTGIWFDGSWGPSIAIGAAKVLATNGSIGLILPSTLQLTWSPDALVSLPDLRLRRAAAANLALGATDAASPVAQKISPQGVVGGTSDTAGASFTIAGSVSTGTGLGGSLIFQTSPAAASTASTQNALVTALTIDSKAHVIHGGTAPTVGGSCGTSPSLAGTDMAGKLTTGTVAPTSCTVTFNKTWTNAPACIAVNETTSNLLKATSTTTTLVLAGTMVASDVLAYVCSGY